MSDHYFDDQGFVYPCAPTSAPPSLNSSSMEAPAVHHDVRMSSRWLPVIRSCFSHRVSDYDHALCCAVCMLWPEEVIQLYA